MNKIQSNNDFKSAIFNNSYKIDNYDDAIKQWKCTDEREITKGHTSKCICGETLRKMEYIIYNKKTKTELILGPQCIKNIEECEQLYEQAKDNRKIKRRLNGVTYARLMRTLKLADDRIKNKK